MNDIPPWSDTAKNLKPGIYRHFKGGEYRLVIPARDSESVEEVVVYQSLEDPEKVWVRPLAMFVETVSRDGYEGPRFSWLREED